MFGRIVVGVGKTDSAKRAAEAAIDLAERYGATLHLVMAFDKSDARRLATTPRSSSRRSPTPR